jgi:SAM-dependent methyltransferase
MDKFYKLLRDHNRSIRSSRNSIPKWAEIFCEEEPPKYWITLGRILDLLPRNINCVEIGSGFGDVLALLLHLGFTNVIGIERNSELAAQSNNKLYKLFSKPDCVIAAEYPIKLPQKPHLLIQVNCIYADGIRKKNSFLNNLRAWHIFNGVPEIYVLEVIDSSFRKPCTGYPLFVRLSEIDIRDTFPGYFVSSFETYQHPNNTSTKRLYVITGLPKIQDEISNIGGLDMRTTI